MIRPFSLSDLGSILNIERTSFPKSPYDSATFIGLHDLYPEHFLVYTGTARNREGQIWGYMIFTPEGHIISLAVLPERRRKGIGKELLRKAMEVPTLKRLRAEVRGSNLGAQAFYSRMGFRTIGIVRDYYGNEDALLIEWIPALPKKD